MVFKKKSSQKEEVIKYEFKLVAQGFIQIPGIDFDKTYFPVFFYETIRKLLAHCIPNQMIAIQLDIKTTFLNSDLDCIHENTRWRNF